MPPTNFGIEIETTIPRISPLSRRYGRLRDTDSPLNRWEIKSDGSLRSKPDFKPIEIVSPVLKGAAGLTNVRATIAELTNIGAKSNSSCGIHIHVQFPQNTAKIRQLVTLSTSLQNALYACTGSNAREKNQYCVPLTNYFDEETEFNLVGGCIRPQKSSGSTRYPYDVLNTRYIMLNILPICSYNVYGGKPTVEFRLFPSEIDQEKVTAWIRMVVGLVDKVTNSDKEYNWKLKPLTSSRFKGVHKSLSMQKFYLMMYALGWIQGRIARPVFGDITDSNLPTIHDSFKTLEELVKQYCTKKEKKSLSNTTRETDQRE